MSANLPELLGDDGFELPLLVPVRCLSRLTCAM
jgi:hypothetical protein